MASNVVRFDAVRSIALASITGSYQAFGPAFTHATRVVHFSNDTNGTYIISFDGVTDNVPILSAGFDLYDLTSNEDDNEMFRYEKGTQLYIKYIVQPTVQTGVSNAVYAVTVYGKGE